MAGQRNLAAYEMESRRQSKMRIRKVLGGFAWLLLAALLIAVNAAASPNTMFDKTEHPNVSSVQK